MAIREEIENLRIKLKNKVPEEQYEDFIIDLKNYYLFCRKKYSFLRIDDVMWDSLFIKSIMKHIDDKWILSGCAYEINIFINNTLRKHIETPGLFLSSIDGLFSSIENAKKGTRRLQELVYIICSIGISFDEKLFLRVKESSSVSEYLRMLGCRDISFAGWQKLLVGYYDNYISVRPYFMSLKECIKATNHLYGLLGLSKEEIPTVSFSSDLERKARILLLNYTWYQKLLVLYSNLYKDDPVEKVEKSIFSMKAEEIELILEECQKFSEAEQAASKNDDFLKLLHNRVHVHTNNNRVEYANFGIRKSSLSNFYERFPLNQGISVEMRKDLIDSIVEATSDNQRQFLVEGIKTGSFRCSESELKKIVESLQDFYARRVERFLNPITKYDCFDLPDNFSSEKRKEFVDVLFDSLEDDELNLLSRYFDGDLTLSERLFREAAKKIGFLRKTYDSTVSKYLNPRELYEYMFSEVKLSDKYKSELTEQVLKDVDDELIADVKAYLDGTRLFLPNESIDIRAKLLRLKIKCMTRYNEYKKEVSSVLCFLKPQVYFDNISYYLKEDSFYEFGKSLYNVKEEYCKVFKKKGPQYEEYRNSVMVMIVQAREECDLETLIGIFESHIKNDISSLSSKAFSV